MSRLVQRLFYSGVKAEWWYIVWFGFVGTAALLYGLWSRQEVWFAWGFGLLVPLAGILRCASWPQLPPDRSPTSNSQSGNPAGGSKSRGEAPTGGRGEA
jgi:hypothetical protein